MPATKQGRRILGLAFTSFALLFLLACGGSKVATNNNVVATPTIAATSTPVPVVQVQTDRVINLRSGPGTDYDVVRKLPVQTAVDLIGVRGSGEDRWFQVQVGEAEGWISSTVIAFEEATVSSLPINKQTLAPPVMAQPRVAQPASQPVAAPSGGRIGAICRDGTRSDATGRGACSWHGGVAEWLYGQ